MEDSNENSSILQLKINDQIYTFTGDDNIEQCNRYLQSLPMGYYHVRLSGEAHGSSYVDDLGLFENTTFQSIDVSELDTSHLTTMKNMFNGMGGMAYPTQIIGLTNLDTSNVTDMSGMFMCYFKPLDLSNFDTSNVTDMSYMFGYYGEAGWPGGGDPVESLDLSNFDTSSVTNMTEMFFNCAVETIYCDNDWNRSGVTSTDMFSYCSNLKGAISYDSTKTDIRYANPTTGYFTIKPPTITFTYTLTDGTGGTRSFTGNDNCAQLATFIHSGSMANNLKTAILCGNGCGDALTVDDYGLFDYCPNLISVDLSNFDTTNVTSMRWMFDFCGKLETIDVSNFNTANVTSMSGMFCMCGVSILDLTNFDVSKVTDTSNMFAASSLLRTIYCNNDWNRAGIDSTDMFSHCSYLKGAIDYDSTKVDINYANPTTGYFTLMPSTKFNNVALTAACFNGNSVDEIYFNNVLVFKGYNYSINYNLTKASYMTVWKFKPLDTPPADSTLTNTICAQYVLEGQGNGFYKLFSHNNTSYLNANNCKMWVRRGTGLNSDVWKRIPFNRDVYWPGVKVAEIYLEYSGSVNPEYMFSGLDNLKAIDIKSNNNTYTSLKGLLRNCTNLEAVNMNNLYIEEITNVESLFEGSSQLTFFTPPHRMTVELDSMNYMLKGCNSLCNVDLRWLTIGGRTEIDDAIEDCDYKNIVFNEDIDFLVMMWLNCGTIGGAGKKWYNPNTGVCQTQLSPQGYPPIWNEKSSRGFLYVYTAE